MKYYAVRVGRQPGIYSSWDECKAQVNGYPNAKYKSFTTLEAAKQVMAPEAKATTEQAECVAYVDGSFDQSTFCYSYGVVLFYQQKKYTFSMMLRDPEMMSMRNVAGEIEGAKKAMQFAYDHQCQSLEICYDYAGIENWCTGQWQANKAGTKAYRDFYLQMSQAMQIRFRKIKSHSNHPLNDEADALAKKALGLDG